MKVEIIFISSSTPKICKNVEAVYTKGGLLCIKYRNRLIVKYPLCNIFSIANFHKSRLGTTKD